MNSKKVLSILTLMIFILSSFIPMLGVNAATQETITLNSSLYKAIKAQLEEKGVFASYNDEQYTLTISQDAINMITELNLSNKEISDLTGLDKFANLKSLDLSANDLTKESNLEVLNSFDLKFLDISSNEISDVSAITNIKEIEEINLHDQIFNEVVVVDNSVVKQGTIKYEVELPQIIREFAKPIKSEWLQDAYINNGTSKLKIDWTLFNANSDSIRVTIGTNAGTMYNGLVTLNIRVTDMNNELYNSEINLHVVVVNENQRGIIFKDRNLYNAVKAQLKRGQSINEDLTKVTKIRNLFDCAYDEQMILVINENDLINEIVSLLVANKRIEDLSGIEMFVGLKNNLDISSNYVDTVDRIVDLQEKKNEEELKLQTRFKEKASKLSEKAETLEKLETSLESIIKEYNEAVKKYNAIVDSNDQNKSEKILEAFKAIQEKGKRYIELSGTNIHLYDGDPAEYTYSIKMLENAEPDANTKLNEVSFVIGEAGEIGSVRVDIETRIKTLHEMYNNMYKVTSLLTPELKNITDEEFDNLTLEKAKALFQAQVSKLSSMEKYLTSYEKDYLSEKYAMDFSEEEKSPVTAHFTKLAETLEENANVADYKNVLNDMRIFGYFTTITNECLIHKFVKFNDTACVGYPEDEVMLKVEDDESYEYIYAAMDKHNEDCPMQGMDIEDIYVIANRIGKASEADIKDGVVLPRLYKLNISENLIEDITKLSVLKELRRLYAADNELVNIYNVDWTAFPKLNTLDLAFNNLSDIKVLETLKGLKSLNLAKNLISGSLDFIISDMKRLEEIDFSSNQIDDIESFLAQYEFIAKAKNMEVHEYLKSQYAPVIRLQNQDLSIEATIEKTGSSAKIELPKIFSQIEKLDWTNTSFGITSLTGNVSSDGKYVVVDTRTIGDKVGAISINGSNIATGTTCGIKYTVVEQMDKLSPEVTLTTNGGTYELADGVAKIATKVTVKDNGQVVKAEYAWATSNVDKQESYTLMDSFEDKELSLDVTEAGTYYLWVRATDNSGNVVETCSQAFVVNPEVVETVKDITVTINTNDGSTVKAVQTVNDTNYIFVPANTKVADVLKEVTLNTEEYQAVIKDAAGENTKAEDATVKTNEALVVDGLDDKAKCVIVVKGDITGDGATSISDIFKLNLYRNGREELTDAEVLAGNVVDSDSEINMNDIIKLNQYRLNKINEL